MTIAKLLEML
jgi:DNA-directed RNA polymerase beta subunit